MTDGNNDLIGDDMKKISKNILEKHLDGRKLNMEKIKTWSEMIINDIGNILKQKYPEFGYGIFFYISDKTACNSSSKSIDYLKTDKNLLQIFNTNDFFSEIRIFANKKYNKRNKFLNNISSEEIIKINKLLQNSLEGRSYIFEKCSNYITNIAQDINNILLARENRPCSTLIGFINQLPTKNLYFTYKFFDLEYMPLFFSYSNDSLSSNIYLFIVNN